MGVAEQDFESTSIDTGNAIAAGERLDLVRMLEQPQDQGEQDKTVAALERMTVDVEYESMYGVRFRITATSQS